MQALGLDLGERGARAVIVDGAGVVLRRAYRSVQDGPAVGLLQEVAAGTQVDAIGVAAEPDATAALASVPAVFGGSAPCASSPGEAAIVAEAWIGAARGARHAVCLSIGERVLAGILLDGRAWGGAHGLAGSAAWLALNPVERQDYRKFGSLAAEVSDTGIARRLSWRIQAGDHSSVLERAGDLEAITVQHVFEGARSGDGVSISVVRDTARYIGMAVANFAAMLDPEIVVLGGSIAAAGDLLLEPVRQECGRRLPPGMADRIRIEISPLGDEAVAIGAARLAQLSRT
jgi:predicted NBD/HSP70 family sugar kinase